MEVIEDVDVEGKQEYGGNKVGNAGGLIWEILVDDGMSGLRTIIHT